jgi:hypothetical protein
LDLISIPLIMASSSVFNSIYQKTGGIAVALNILSIIISIIYLLNLVSIINLIFILLPSFIFILILWFPWSDITKAIMLLLSMINLMVVAHSYCGLFGGRMGSTSGLTFIFLPVYILAVQVIVVLLVLAIDTSINNDQ